jgi:hypothetical protein
MCDPKNDKANALLKLLPLIPRDRLIIGSDAPRFTPQNIDDPYVREMKNEPSNMPWALKYFAESLNVPLEELGETIRQNTKKFYRLRDKDEAPLEGEIEGTDSDDQSFGLNLKKIGHLQTLPTMMLMMKAMRRLKTLLKHLQPLRPMDTLQPLRRLPRLSQLLVRRPACAFAFSLCANTTCFWRGVFFVVFLFCFSSQMLPIRSNTAA